MFVIYLFMINYFLIFQVIFGGWIVDEIEFFIFVYGLSNLGVLGIKRVILFGVNSLFYNGSVVFFVFFDNYCDYRGL